MESTRYTSFIVITIAFILAIQLLMVSSALAQDRNSTSGPDPNNTRLIVDLKNRTITLVDKTTNETISVKDLTPKATANATIEENITTNAENATINENFTPENTIINDTLTTNTGNATTSLNLTDKFNALQGK